MSVGTLPAEPVFEGLFGVGTLNCEPQEGHFATLPARADGTFSVLPHLQRSLIDDIGIAVSFPSPLRVPDHHTAGGRGRARLRLSLPDLIGDRNGHTGSDRYVRLPHRALGCGRNTPVSLACAICSTGVSRPGANWQEDSDPSQPLPRLSVHAFLLFIQRR